MAISIRTYIMTALVIVGLLFAGITWAQQAAADMGTSEVINQITGKSEPDLMALVSASEQTGRGVEAAQNDCENPASPKCVGRFQAE